MAHECDFGIILGPLWAYKRRMAGMTRVVAGLMVALSAPRGHVNRKYTFLQVMIDEISVLMLQRERLSLSLDTASMDK